MTYPYKNNDEMYEKLLIGAPVSKIIISYTPSAVSLHLPSFHPMELRPESIERMYTGDGGIKQYLTTQLSPKSIDKLSRYFRKEADNDRKVIEYDEEYIPDPEKELGVYMENYLCSKLYCPICGDTLYKYSLSNQPTVDLYCNGNHEVQFFQVKTRRSSSYIPGEYNKYFDINAPIPYIHVGSYRYGKYTHSITPIDRHLYKMLIGYIVIEYNYIIDKPREITIVPSKSYIIYPNTTINPKRGDKYYTYLHLQEFGDNVITFDKNNMICKKFTDVYPFNKFDISYQFDLDDITTPKKLKEPRCVKRLRLDSKYKEKYLKYKSKYLNLLNESYVKK
jgi:hypothetical protein